MYSYILPNEKNERIFTETECQSMIIIGANGSGKTRLGAWIEKQIPQKTHRICAQRVLKLGKYIQQRSLEQASNLLTCGQETESTTHDSRWGWDGEKYNYVTSSPLDYEIALSALYALQVKQSEEYIEDCKLKEKNGEDHNKVPEMVFDKLKRIWNDIFPHREISISDGKVIAIMSDDEKKCEYLGKEMSDGERVTLYLMAQCLAIPKDKIIIIDEPEIHLHRSIMNKLWTAIENERKDCFFIYITHDTQFAANHKNSKKIWVKKFDGENWDLEEIEDSSIPEQLLLDILGNRKPVLFVEGKNNSYDVELYSKIYKDYYVVPCGSCRNVIEQTKAMNKNSNLHNLKCYGIIDRDYRSEYEINSYKKDNIYTLKVAEIENLFLVEELLNIVNDNKAFDNNSIVEEVKNYVINERFAREIEKQICNAIIYEIKFKLSTANISGKKEDKLNEALDNFMNKFSSSYENMKVEKNKFFNDILYAKKYEDVLMVFNCKGLANSVGHFFKIDDKDYVNFILRSLKNKNSEIIIDAIRKYLPEEIPMSL